MKNNHFLLALAFCIGLQCNTSIYSSEQVIEDKPQQSYWQMYAPQFMRDTASATSDYIASWIPDRIKNAVNKMSTKTKIALAVAILVSLGAYNREAIIALVNNALPTSPSSDATTMRAYPGDYNKETEKKSAEYDFNFRVQEIMRSIGDPTKTGMIPVAPKELNRLYLELHPNAQQDPAYQEAMKRLSEKGISFSKYGVDLTKEEMQRYRAIAHGEE